MPRKTVGPQDFVLQPEPHEAMQWNPGDPEAVGAMIGWLAAYGVRYNHPSGTGPDTTIMLAGDFGPIVPGGWIVRRKRDNRFFSRTAEEFAGTFWPDGPDDE
jgi:hypothetical protein